MSAYRVIQTEFRNLPSLLKALADMGYSNGRVEVGHNTNDLPMYGYHGDVRPETCAIRIDRKHIGSASNDVGFAWNGSTYQAIVSSFDSRNTWTPEVMGKLKQAYAFQELSRQAKAKGYTVQQEKTPAGTIRMKLVKR